MKARVVEFSAYCGLFCLVFALHSGILGVQFSRFQILSFVVFAILLVIAVLLIQMKWTDFKAKREIRALILAEAETRVAARTVENYARLFQKDLIGVWSQDVGTFSQVHDEIWKFGADGSGEIVVLGPFGGERERAQFEWRRAGDFVLQMRLTRGFGEEMDENQGENRFKNVRYEFRLHSSDGGETPALFEVGREGFWLSQDPLSPHQWPNRAAE